MTARFAAFFELLPRSTGEALRLARKRDRRMHGRSRLAIDLDRPLRHAIEIRHESFRDEDFIALLRQHQVALVVAETADAWPLLEDVTADFVYLRLHGDKELYRSGYGAAALNRWAARIREWYRGAEPTDARRITPPHAARSRSRDIFCFFDNTDVKLRAPVDAQALMRKLGVEPCETLPRSGRRPRREHRDPAFARLERGSRGVAAR